MTEFSRLSKPTLGKSGNNIANDGLSDATPRVPPGTPDVPGVLQDLMADADGLIKNGEPLDDAWMSTAAAYLARAISDGDADSVVGSQTAFRRLATRIHHATHNLAEDPDDVPGEAAAESTQAWVARQVLDQVNVLIQVADAGAGIVRPRGLGVRIEPGSMVARILVTLTQHAATPNDDLRSSIGTTKSQLSRACSNLSSQGLITRRTQGRRAAWTLTAAGAEAAKALRALESSPAGETNEDGNRGRTAVTAHNAAELRRAIEAWTQVIAVNLTPDHGDDDDHDDGHDNVRDVDADRAGANSWEYEVGLCRYVRTTAVDAESISTRAGLAPVVIRTDDPETTYVRQDWWAHSGAVELEEQSS